MTAVSASSEGMVRSFVSTARENLLIRRLTLRTFDFSYMKRVLLLFGLLVTKMSQLNGQSPTPLVSQTVSPPPQPSQSPVVSPSPSPSTSASPRGTRKFQSQALKFQPTQVVPMISPSASPSPKPTSRHKKKEKDDGKDAKKSTPVPEY
jgi:hypothetical protein